MAATPAAATTPSRKSSRTDETEEGPETKKMKVRKGTRSCWECRRRKMKCIFDSPADYTCVSCQRRGAKCVAQQFPEEVSTSLERSLQMGDRIVRLEALVEKLIQGAPEVTVLPSQCQATKESKPSQDRLITAPTNSASPKLADSCKASVVDETVQYQILDTGGSDGPREPTSAKDRLAGPGRHKGLSKVLHESLPAPKDIEIITRARGNMSARFFEMMTTTYNDLAQADAKTLQSLFEIPGPNVHPVLIGRKMLWIATFLQHIHPHLHNDIDGMSEPPQQIMKRLADTCISLVTTNDDILSSLEGLECIMIESLYHTNGGNLRKGLIAIRRAVVMAQLMGFHRPGIQPAQCNRLDPKTQANPSFLWYRVLFSERHLCLMLGLPQSTTDHSMASEVMLAKDSPMGRLERIHCTIASRILERNQSDPSSNKMALRQQLDGELKKAAENMPAKWWLAANLATVLDNPEALFWDMRRLFHQLFHYNLLNQLHLPYMLRSNSTGDGDDYSRITCVNASREVLSRFMMFQSIDRISFWCRTMHYFSLVAALTLIIAHLDGHRRGAAGALRSSQQQGQHRRETDNLLTHQRPGDRAMVEQVQERMEEMSRLNEDTLGAQSAELLRRLLIIEAEGAVVAENQAGELERDQGSSVRVYIPHFGTIKIGPEGIFSKAVPKAIPSAGGNNGQTQHREAPDVNVMDTDGIITEAAAFSPSLDTGTESLEPIGTANSAMTFDRCDETLVGSEPPMGEILTQPAVAGDNLTSTQYATSDPSTLPQFGLREDGHLPTVGGDDLALQGVDMAFFDSLMKEFGDSVNGGSEWLTWPNEA